MAEKGTVTKAEEAEVTDESLSLAFDEATGEKTEEVREDTEEKKEESAEAEPPVEEAPVEETASAEPPKEQKGTEEHKESSKLGRKVHGLLERQAALEKELAELKGQKGHVELEVPEVITTAEDVDKVIEARTRKQLEARNEYQQQYLKQIQVLKGDDEELHNEIVAELLNEQSPYNKQHSWNAPADASMNYARAMASILKNKLSGKKLPNRATATPVQPAANATRTAARPITMPKLDPEAASYVAYLRKQGVSEEDIAKELV